MKFELTVEEANMVLVGLGELPAKHSIALIEKIKQQAAPQMQEAKPVEAEVVV